MFSSLTVARKSQPKWIFLILVDVLLRNNVLDVERDEWRCLLRDAAVLAAVGGAPPNKITGRCVHVPRNAVLRNGGPSTG